MLLTLFCREKSHMSCLREEIKLVENHIGKLRREKLQMYWRSPLIAWNQSFGYAELVLRLCRFFPLIILKLSFDFT